MLRQSTMVWLRSFHSGFDAYFESTGCLELFTVHIMPSLEAMAAAQERCLCDSPRG